jgi:hypothetical protein
MIAPRRAHVQSRPVRAAPGNKSEKVQLLNPQKDADFTFPSGRSDNDAIA